MEHQQRRISDLTIDEFRALLQEMMHDILLARLEQKPDALHPQAGLLDIEPVSVGPWKAGLQLIRREDYYDDER
jgi:hypothetical protein